MSHNIKSGVICLFVSVIFGYLSTVVILDLKKITAFKFHHEVNGKPAIAYNF